jgi:hypothetical protein
MKKVYEATISCKLCKASLTRHIDRSVHPRTVRHDTELLFKQKYACPHTVHANVETRVFTNDIVESKS